MLSTRDITLGIECYLREIWISYTLLSTRDITLELYNAICKRYNISYTMLSTRYNISYTILSARDITLAIQFYLLEI